MTPDPDPDRTHRASAPRLAAVLVLLLVTVLAVSGTSGASGAPGAAGGSSLRFQADAPVPLEPRLLELVDLSTFVAPDDVLRLAFRLDDAPEGATFELALHPRVRNRIRFAETVAGLRLGSPLRTFGDLDAATLPRDERGVVQLDLQVVSDGEVPLAGIRIPDQGVYPLSLTVLDVDGQELDRLVGHVVRLPEAGADPDARPLATSVVVPLDTTAPALRPDGSTQLDANEQARLEGLLDVVDGDVPVALAPVPETLDALAADGDALGPVADGNAALAATYVPLHLSSWQQQDGGATFDTALRQGDGAIQATLGVAPDPTTWLVDPTVDPVVLGTLVDHGVRRAIVPGSILSPLDADDFPVTLTNSFTIRDDRGRQVSAVQTDAGVESHLRSSDQPTLAANRALADLAVLGFDLPLAARGAALSTRDVPTPTVDALLEGLRAASEPSPTADPLLRPTTPGALFDHVAPAEVDGVVLERTWVWEPPTDLGAIPDERAGVDATIAGYPSMLTTDDVAVRNARRLQLVAADRRIGSPDEAHAYLDGATTVIGERLGAVRAPEQGSVTLTSSTASIPVVLDNGLDVPVQVQLGLDSEKLDFPGGSTVPLTLVPGHNRIEVDVRARASGVFPVELTLTTPDGAIQLGESQVRVRSAAVSGLGVALSIGAGLFLCVWWARNWRTTRKSRSLVDGGSLVGPGD